MKILNLGLDNSALRENSALAGRLVDYGRITEKYSLIAASENYKKVELAPNVTVYGSGGSNKIARLINIYRLGKKLLAAEKYDLVSAQDQYYLALVGLKLARRFKLGLEIQAHGFEKLGGLRQAVAKYVLPRAGAIRCVSLRLKKELLEKFKVAEEKITVVPIFCQLPAVNLQPQNKNNGKFIFLTVGRLAKVKNIGLQIESMAEVIKKYPTAELWIIGDGPEKRNFELLIKNYGLEEKVKLLGWQPNMENYYSRADAFILTSLAEGWGLAVIEAASFGLPIIMTDVGCAGEIIKNGQSGIIIPVCDKFSLTAAMLKIMVDDNLRKKLGDGAKLAAGCLPDKEQTLALYKKSWQLAAKAKL